MGPVARPAASGGPAAGRAVVPAAVPVRAGRGGEVSGLVPRAGRLLGPAPGRSASRSGGSSVGASGLPGPQRPGPGSPATRHRQAPLPSGTRRKVVGGGVRCAEPSVPAGVRLPGPRPPRRRRVGPGRLRTPGGGLRAPSSRRPPRRDVPRGLVGTPGSRPGYLTPAAALRRSTLKDRSRRSSAPTMA